ncbi:MAG: hypothetical protein HY22_08935 [[Candidatus Thermochlorobacteriaceae] bacterium GBChlB]|nr:MAG: hypothetical protein HY22_08935 [[Candidatus Thermochlorobacteriaceae] bacterium GBChlB]
MKSTVYLAVFICLSVFISACSRNATDPAPTSERVSLRLEPVIGSQALDTNVVVQLNGRNARFNQARIYISDIALIRENNEEVRFTDEPLSVRFVRGAGDTAILNVTDKIILFRHDAGNRDAALGTALTGRYKAIRFTVGLNDQLNRIDALEAARLRPTHSLARTSSPEPSNWWSWNSGYIFTRVEGFYDNSPAGTGAPNTRFFYHIGGPTDFASSITLSQPFEIRAGETNVISVQVDYARFFAGIDLATAPNCMVIRNPALFPNDRRLGEQFRDNQRTANAFRFRP